MEEIERQEGDADSPLQFFKRVFALRAREKSLGIGEMEELPNDRRREVFCALRTSQDGTERAVTAFNFTSTPLTVTAQLGARGVSEFCNFLSGERMRPDANGGLALSLGPYGFKLLRVVPAS